MILLTRPFTAEPSGFVAVDTETDVPPPPETLPGRKSRISKPPIPELVIASWAEPGESVVLSPDELIKRLHEAASGLKRLVFHNAAFDIPVILKFCPEVRPLFVQLVEENRIFDTLYREMLLDNAYGRLDLYEKGAYSLQRLALKRCGIVLGKGEERITFGDYKNALEDLPDAHRLYAVRDAEATYRLFQAQQPLIYNAARGAQAVRYPSLPGAGERFGCLGESIQVRGSLALQWLEQFPLRVDLEAANARERALADEQYVLENLLIEFGWARRTPKTKQFKRKDKAIREALAHFAAARTIQPNYSDTGLLSLEDRFWGAHIPPWSLGCPCEDLEQRLGVWMRHSRVRKLLGTYLQVYSASAVHYPRYRTFGALTSRVAASRPNIQQIPKHRDGIRELFVADSGHKLLEADFRAAELVALAQIWELMFGESELGKAINCGDDPHTALAIRIVGEKRWECLNDDSKAAYRQMAKSCNFGLAGGLGAKKFGEFCRKRYGLQISSEEARRLRSQALKADPALKKYLKDIRAPRQIIALAAENLGFSSTTLYEYLGTNHPGVACARLRDWVQGNSELEIPEPPGFDRQFDLFRSSARTLSGMVRGKCSYTEAHNTPFQAAVADASKLALWELYKRWAPDCGWVPVVFVHDSILIEAREDRIEEASKALVESMDSGMRMICPFVSEDVELVELSEPKDNWG